MKLANGNLAEWGIGAAIVLALLALVDPWDIWMPPAVVMTLSLMLAVLVIGFAVFWWREQPKDERESINSMRAGRVSYLAGGAVLLIGVVVQSFMHHIDPWLPGALGAMVLAKLVLSAWYREK